MPRVKFHTDWRHFERGDVFDTNEKMARILTKDLTVANRVKGPSPKKKTAAPVKKKQATPGPQKVRGRG